MAKRPTKAEQAEADRAAEAAETQDNDSGWDDGDDTNDDGDTGDDGEGKGEGTPDDPVRVALVPEPAAEEGFTEALTPGQRAGLEPMDRMFDNEQAADRDHLTNRQTDHERENALDPVSSDPNAGVTSAAPLTAVATGAPVSDMSGRPALSVDDSKSLDLARRVLGEARSDDKEKPTLQDGDRQGWRTPQQIGVAGGVMARLQAIYPDRIEFEEVPNGHHFPETGRRYRLK